MWSDVVDLRDFYASPLGQMARRTIAANLHAIWPETTGQAVLGDPRKALTWFVNEASSYCGGVKAGQFVTTGTCIIPMAIKPGDEVSVDYGELGAIACRIA
jgi:2-keto-4-pentenoate hydratase